MRAKKRYAYHVCQNGKVCYIGAAIEKEGIINVHLLHLPIDGKIQLVDKKLKGKPTIEKLKEAI